MCSRLLYVLVSSASTFDVQVTGTPVLFPIRLGDIDQQRTRSTLDHLSSPQTADWKQQRVGCCT